MNKVYAGIGSTETPDSILNIMTDLAEKFAELGWTLRSGGAIGADRAFEAGAIKKEIFLASDATPESICLTSKFHPAWERCGRGARKNHGRNAMILLGADLKSQSDLVVCWTSNGKERGGTGQGMRIAKAFNIPVKNLYHEKHIEDLYKLIKNFNNLK